MPRSTTAILIAILVTAAPGVHAADPPANAYLDFIKAQAATLRAGDKPPGALEEWQARKQELRKKLLTAWGGFPTDPAPLDPQNHGELKRDGYRVEKVTFQTRPGVRMTANAYVPDKTGRLPAILMVHGHWRGAKQDPTVQARCIGAARLGFFVLCVDAFGAGERAVGTALGEYHGDMTAATLLPVGLPLSGLQVYENTRAVDYLLTRPEVDKDRIGITGASGGGNQTMYAGAWDERLKCVVPVCSVGNYQAYLGAACCMCEVVPGALTFTEESGLLAMVAPRGLMVISATRDAFQFSVGEAKKSLAGAQPVFKLLGKPGNVRHAIFESAHDYSKLMREEMYGWMTLHLKGEGDGSPIPEPAIKTENPEDLRCFPGDTRPKAWATIPKFAAAEGKKLLAARPIPQSAEEWRIEAEQRRTALRENVLGGFPDVKPVKKDREGLEGLTLFDLQTEPGLTTELRYQYDPKAAKGTRPFVVLLSLEGGRSVEREKLERSARAAGWSTLTFDLRATGKLAYATDKVRQAPDHNTAEWALWAGRPLLGQWTFEVRQALTACLGAGEKAPEHDVIVIGEGPAALVALCAAATDQRITKVAAVGALPSYITDEPYVGQRLGVMAPGILREVGDVAHLAALVAPRRVVMGRWAHGRSEKALPGEPFRAVNQPATQVWELLKSPKELVILEWTDEAGVISALK